MAGKEKASSFGAKLRQLREQEGWALEDLAEHVSLKPAYLARLEQDEVLPSVAEILTLARTLSVEPAAFMGQEAGKRSTEKRRAAREKRTQDYAYQVLSPEEPERHLMAFQVTIDPQSEHRKVGYRHEGEEFIYVLAGQLHLTVGRKTTPLQTGGSIHFDSGQQHKLRNPGHEPARLLVVIYHP